MIDYIKVVLCNKMLPIQNLYMPIGELLSIKNLRLHFARLYYVYDLYGLI